MCHAWMDVRWNGSAHQPTKWFSMHALMCISHRTQVAVLCTRMLRNWLRNPVMLASECVQYVFMSVFVGENWVGGRLVK